jgi:hypothetical protein
LAPQSYRNEFCENMKEREGKERDVRSEEGEKEQSKEG